MTNPPSEQDPQRGPEPASQQHPQQHPQQYPHYPQNVQHPQYPQPTQAFPAYTRPQGGAPYGYAYGPPDSLGAPAKQRHPWRAAAAGALAGAVLAAAVAVPTTIAIAERGGDSAASPSAGSQQQNPFGQFGQGDSSGLNPFGQDPTTGGSTTQQSGTNATDAQSQGVVLVDTVVSGGEGAGTGMVIDSDGLVLTNYHVVANSSEVKVTVATSGKTYTATVVGRDKSADVALLKLEGASGLDTVKLDDDGVDLKEPVTAVGNASGQGFLSAVEGTVVAEDQHITASEGGRYGDSEALTGLIETDAAVVPGYSGGPLLDAQGEVVGIDTAASTATSAMGAVRNAGQAYAIPIEDALKIVEQIENGDESGPVQIGPSAFLGISVDQAAGGTTGAAVAGVEADGPAASAGLAAGDTVTAVDGTTVRTYAALTEELATHEPGDQVKVTWRTAAGQTKTATVTLGSSPVN